MQYEFLKHFPRRMKNVGLYAVLANSSGQKLTWKQYGFTRFDEQINVIFTVLLYLMEQSLREENCTMDDIGAYLDSLNSQYFRKDISCADCRELGDFVVNVILSNEGRAMYFDGYNFDQNAYQIMHIQYVANRIIYTDQDQKRTSYYLTDDGYNLLLSTLEIENNMKLTIQEMIFRLHLEKQSYDKAADDVKNVFHLLRIQLQKIQEAMGRIRRNALDYSVKDYKRILEENLETIGDTRQKFKDYRDLVKKRARELEEENINVKSLGEKEMEKLSHLRVIESYLNRAIDEHQRILNSHFDLKSLYTKELEQLTQMAYIKRFSLRTELYEPILSNPEALGRLDYFLRPLFNRDPGKIYHPGKAFQLKKVSAKKEEEELAEELDFDEEAWIEEQEKRRREKMALYEKSLSFLIDMAGESGEITLKEAAGRLSEEEERRRLIPTVDIFKEIMVELIKNGEIDLLALKKEKSEFIQERSMEFQLNETLLRLWEEKPHWKEIEKILVTRIGDGEMVWFDGVFGETGVEKSVRCSNVRIQLLRKEQA